MIRDKGRMAWQKAVGYRRRSLGETAMFRYKAIVGRCLRARTLSVQRTEAKIACSVLNQMTRPGIPVSQRIASDYRHAAAARCTKAQHDSTIAAERGIRQ